ncbi:hypothetical protein NQ314_000073 [Rhamnusium bicolor]|uniref:DUF4218 domain-containing protein n=1 Tax=Rhamnusium bicolor TaxID=1586634 RepID=A0AAV8ZYI3_9CUCU|nr:hypothetical protein NQ314_000073 [Rhamnusium bicolor]
MVKLSICSEFARKPRPLDDIDRWKATELRQFLLYTGPVILKNILTKSKYDHFMSLSVAIRIFLSEMEKLYEYANSLLVYFVEKYDAFYGRENLSYNVHNLIHLYGDINNFGTLDGISAFKFENFMYKLKKKVKTSAKPLVQAYKRISEELSQNLIGEHRSYPYVGKMLRIFESISYYDSIHFRNFMLSVKSPVNFCILENKDILEIVSIYKKNDEILLSGNLYSKKVSLFASPCESIL